MSDATYRVFCEARKGSPLAEGEFEATYSRVEAAWIEKVESSVREQIARDIADKTPDGRKSQAFCAGMDRAARIVRGVS